MPATAATASFQKSVSRGCGALTAQMLILAGSIGTSIDALQSLNNVIAQQSNHSIIMPPSIVVPAMPVKGIIDPARVRTVWRSPKRVSPHGTDHATDDCSRRSGDDKSSSGAKGCADCVRSRTRRRSRHQRDGRACQERRLAQACPNRKTRHSSHGWTIFGIDIRLVFFRVWCLAYQRPRTLKAQSHNVANSSAF